MAVEVSQAWLGFPPPTIAVDVSQAFLATPPPPLGVAVSQAFFQTPGSVVRSGSATQNVGTFTSVATLQVVGATQVDVSWTSLYLPEGANATRNAEATQTVGNFTTAASMSDIIGQINGGGTITEGYPHRSASATQTVGSFDTAAAGGGEGVLAPDLVRANQNVGAFTTVAVADLYIDAAASQQVGSFTQDFRNYDTVATPRTRGGGGAAPVRRESRRKFVTEVNGVTISAKSLFELQRKVDLFMAQQPEQEAPQDAPEPAVEAPQSAPVVVAAVEPAKAPEPTVPAAELERLASEFVAQQQAMAAEIEALRTQAAFMAANAQVAITQTQQAARDEVDAVAALLMDEWAPAPQYVPVPVMLPAELPPKPEPKPDPLDNVTERLDELTKMVKELTKA